MTPAEHYAEAGRCLDLLKKYDLDPGDKMADRLLALAQVHALLALAPNPPVIHVVNPR